MALLVAAIISVILLCLAIFVAGVSLPPSRIASFFALEVLGVLPFAALGLLVGTLVKGQGAPGVVNLIYLPMAFLSGLWFPLSVMPAFLQSIAPLWPAYHLNRLALSAVGLGQDGEALHAAVLLGFTVAFVLIAARRLRRHG